MSLYNVQYAVCKKWEKKLFCFSTRSERSASPPRRPRRRKSKLKKTKPNKNLNRIEKELSESFINRGMNFDLLPTSNYLSTEWITDLIDVVWAFTTIQTRLCRLALIGNHSLVVRTGLSLVLRFNLRKFVSKMIWYSLSISIHPWINTLRGIFCDICYNVGGVWLTAESGKEETQNSSVENGSGLGLVSSWQRRRSGENPRTSTEAIQKAGTRRPNPRSWR